MRAVVIPEPGPAEILEIREVERPAPGPGEILMKVGAVSVNRSYDLAVRQGTSPFGPAYPITPGVDPSGEVVAVGEGVDADLVGRRVAVLGMVRCGQCAPCRSGGRCQHNKAIGVKVPGGCAEYVILDPLQVRPIPDALGYAEATVVVRHGAAASAEMATAKVQPGETVLVMGAAGGLANILIQLAKNAGAIVIAAAGSPERVAAGTSVGADHGVDYRAADLVAEVQRITEGKGVDVVFDNIGDPELFRQAFACLGTDGRLVTMGYHGGGVVPVDVKQLHIKRLKILSAAPTKGDADLLHCLDLAAQGKLIALIGRRFALDEVAEAHRVAEGNGVVGKVIIEP